MVVQQDSSSGIMAPNGEPTAIVPSPWAVDANGVNAPTQFEVSENSLTQVVGHRERNFAYPISADPQWWNAIVSAAKWLGPRATWLRGKVWSGVKWGARGAKFAAKKIGPFGLALCAVGAGWAWYRSDARGWVRVGDAVTGCIL